jgi:hypothetical protein
MVALTVPYFSKVYHMTESKGQGLCHEGLHSYLYSENERYRTDRRLE